MTRNAPVEIEKLLMAPEGLALNNKFIIKRITECNKFRCLKNSYCCCCDGRIGQNLNDH